MTLGPKFISEARERFEQHAGLQSNRLKNGTPRGVILCQELPRGLCPASSAQTLRFPSVASATAFERGRADVGRRRATQPTSMQTDRREYNRSSITGNGGVRTANKSRDLGFCPHRNHRTGVASLHPLGSASRRDGITKTRDKPDAAIQIREASDEQLTNRDTTSASDEEESFRGIEGNSETTGEREVIATRERDYTPFTNLSVAVDVFINYYYWYQYNTNQPTNQQVVVSPVIPQLSSQGVAA